MKSAVWVSQKYARKVYSKAEKKALTQMRGFDGGLESETNKTGTYPRHPASVLHRRLAITSITAYSDGAPACQRQQKFSRPSGRSHPPRVVPATLGSKGARVRREEISAATTARCGVLEKAADDSVRHWLMVVGGGSLDLGL
jgi:hypothetical protein